MIENNIYKLMDMKDKDNKVCSKIDKFLGDEKEMTSDEIGHLLEDAEDVICGYRSLLYEILKDVSIGAFVRK